MESRAAPETEYIIYAFNTQTIIAKIGLIDPHIDRLFKKLINY